MQKKKVRSESKPKGKSKYAKKVSRRNKLAAQLGFPAGTPYPILWLNQ